MRSLKPLQPVVKIEGVVEHGFGRGSKSLGFPTANLNGQASRSLSEFLVSPKCSDGVYIGWATIESNPSVFKAAISVGINPTFEDSRVRLLEAHLIDYNGPNFYDSKLRLVLVGFIRESKKFESLDALKDAIWSDCEFARQWLDKNMTGNTEPASTKFLHWED